MHHVDGNGLSKGTVYSGLGKMADSLQDHKFKVNDDQCDTWYQCCHNLNEILFNATVREVPKVFTKMPKIKEFLELSSKVSADLGIMMRNQSFEVVLRREDVSERAFLHKVAMNTIERALNENIRTAKNLDKKIKQTQTSPAHAPCIQAIMLAARCVPCTEFASKEEFDEYHRLTSKPIDKNAQLIVDRVKYLLYKEHGWRG